MPTRTISPPESTEFFQNLFRGVDFPSLGGIENFGGPGFWDSIFVAARTVFIVLDIILLIAFLWVFMKAWQYRPRLEPYKVRQKRSFTIRDAVFKERWDFLTRKVAESKTVDALKLAIIEADKLADDALKKLGVRGEHMADRLEHLSSGEMRTLERLWRAHRLRNDLVHTPDFNLTPELAGRTLEDYRAFLKEIGVLVE